MDFFGQGIFQNYQNLFSAPAGYWLIPLILWSFIWKGLALWYSARNEEKYWFVAILILNTVGILEIAYLFFFAKKKLKIDSLLKNIKPQ